MSKNPNTSSSEISKLHQHIALLREEFVKLQTKYNAVVQENQLLKSDESNTSRLNFTGRILKAVADLFTKEIYSDIKVIGPNEQVLHCHKFVLAARSNNWGVDLAQSSEIDLSEVDYSLLKYLFQWVYTDQLEPALPEDVLLELLKMSGRFRLEDLGKRCEQSLIPSVTVRNCIRYYQEADYNRADLLKSHCSQLISTYWHDFTSEDFKSMPAGLLYSMFKAKTKYPLHAAIRARRDDVMMLYLVEFTRELPFLINQIDDLSDHCLDLALRTKQMAVADELIKNGVDKNMRLNDGKSFLHLAIDRADRASAEYLIEKGVDLNQVTNSDGESALHRCASTGPLFLSREAAHDMAVVAGELLSRGADPNLTTFTERSTPLHRSVESDNAAVCEALLDCTATRVDVFNRDRATPLWLAVCQEHPEVASEQNSPDANNADTNMISSGIGNEHEANANKADDLCEKLLKRGASVDAVHPETGFSMLIRAAMENREGPALYLLASGADPKIANDHGETALHWACANSLRHLVRQLLATDIDLNAQTNGRSQLTASDLSCRRPSGLVAPVDNPFDDENKLPNENGRDRSVEDLKTVTAQTALHVAISRQNRDIVDEMLSSGNTHRLYLAAQDSRGQSALGLALDSGQLDLAAMLVRGSTAGGVDVVNLRDASGRTLLHSAIQRQDIRSVQFLLQHGADLRIRCDGRSALQLAIELKQPSIVNSLCENGADVNERFDNAEQLCPLWLALQLGLEDVASVLVTHNCDRDVWHEGPEGCQWSMLHRALDSNEESIASFLARSLCDLNAPKRPGPNGEGGDLASDLQTPLHVACSWGQETAVQTLMEMEADVNRQDSEGKTPLHCAIENDHSLIIQLLVSHPLIKVGIADAKGNTPFASAMLHKNNKAASAILRREPSAVDQHDNRGRSFLHRAVERGELESVLFVLSVASNQGRVVNLPVRDTRRLSPLQIASMLGHELIVRNLILAQADVNYVNPSKQSALHLAAEHNQPTICTVLLENGANVNLLDDSRNNALHVAVQHGNIGCVRVLLNSDVDVRAVNMRGLNPLHVLARYAKDNAPAIFELFLDRFQADMARNGQGPLAAASSNPFDMVESAESVPPELDLPDADGNTALLLAYMNGFGALSAKILSAGAKPSVVNRQGQSLFNYPVASTQLLSRLLDLIPFEPGWTDAEQCMQCSTKFSLTTRKHHCRHCGRALCAKCSAKDIPIVKFNLSKPVRVCNTCLNILTSGSV